APRIRNEDLPFMISAELSITCALVRRSAIWVKGGEEKYAVACPLFSASAAIACACDNVTIWLRKWSKLPNVFSACISKRYICGELSVGTAMRSPLLRSAIERASGRLLRRESGKDV